MANKQVPPEGDAGEIWDVELELVATVVAQALLTPGELGYIPSYYAPAAHCDRSSGLVGRGTRARRCDGQKG